MISIAIDGPAGVGKSTISKELAAEYKLAYLDTGAMYRAVTWWFLQNNITDDQMTDLTIDTLRDRLTDFCAHHLTLSFDPEDRTIMSDDTDISEALYSKDVTDAVSHIASLQWVRDILVRVQKQIVADAVATTGIILEGRDTTTIIAPKADVRILLTADENVRINRRHKQLGDTDNIIARDAEDAKVNNFTTASKGVLTIDNSDMSLNQTLRVFEQIIDIALEKYDTQLPLTDNDEAEDFDEYDISAYEDLEDKETEEELNAQKLIGVLAVIGRPNVGKSTLVNRILRRKSAIVEDTPGVTRDRISYEAEWCGDNFLLVDTGGWEANTFGIDSEVANQAQVAAQLADAVLFVVDAHTGITNTDEQIVRMLRRMKKPVLIAVNKIDKEDEEAYLAEFWKLGLGKPFSISAMHGRGIGDLLDECVNALKKAPHTSELFSSTSLRRVALIGRPNVGKSSLLNQLANEQRSVVNNEAGTTRDPVDEVVTLGGSPWLFIDTAGIKRKLNKIHGADYYSTLRSQAAIERSELCLVLIDVSQPVAEQDLRVMSQAINAGKAIVLLFNKWDLLDDYGRERIERLYKSEFEQVTWAERINISAKNGWHMNRLAHAMETALLSWDKRIPTSKLNTFLGKIQSAHPHPLRGGKQPRILFATQASNRPPKFVIFTTGVLDHSYVRYIEHQLRNEFDFTGTPIQLVIKVREKK
ncbi:MAG: bifunctional cytidylate kinase/GTPase Der [Aeriscardovia sp.]|nr:bifunctional cytidylate kinase/GTPase Der [Aeriscardovia sp.]